MMNEELSFEQRLHNAIGGQEIENVKARHSLWHAMSYSKEEWDNIWHKGKNATWAHFFGRMVGFEEVWSGSVIDADEDVYTRFTAKCRQDPAYSHLDIRSTGSSGCHNLASPVIEVAADGKTARASYLTPGMTAMGGGVSSYGSNCGIFWERYGSDFCCEPDGKWVYFHEQVCPDVMGSYTQGGNWGHDLFESARRGQIRIGGGMSPNNITDPGPLHCDLSAIQTVQRTVPWPEPYETMDDANTYSPGRIDHENDGY